ncbi:MAG: hypothetical protein A2233_04490 [Candidatus Kerfeldbacteria bacterium RIFOXYA2_FULL_38_24]|uniref:Uncharacterized protein n=1 Tax=Candidatus Kerfeldbacteria bacterium RIFOXYB2_FULL_38_14 TaxID=1798547 RepID=A0A1G2BDS3_9BACT|nr:MAG: hypothetical protein A2233_04490 [Candidatus Kerfeldbacteria bacterium RIFOXYA2_FULL_38_24]OGY86357.1 MAG: hypothetical protein A2319_03090 [Candidatus Kerfeldbacteria bacterium RIFOXYB2_FULL_38_14]
MYRIVWLSCFLLGLFGLSAATAFSSTMKTANVNSDDEAIDFEQCLGERVPFNNEDDLNDKRDFFSQDDATTGCRYRTDRLSILTEEGWEFDLPAGKGGAVTGCSLWHSGSKMCWGGTWYEWVCWSGSWYCALYSPSCFYAAIGCC